MGDPGAFQHQMRHARPAQMRAHRDPGLTAADDQRIGCFNCHARAGVGAVASQNVTDPRLGPLALDLMAEGLGAAGAIAAVRARGRHIDYQQALPVDGQGRTALHSGSNALGIWAEARGADVASGGNLLADAGVPAAIAAGFHSATGHIGDRLLAAMQAGWQRGAGGEPAPIHSAGLKMVDGVSWPAADLRCDRTEGCPIAAVAPA